MQTDSVTRDQTPAPVTGLPTSKSNPLFVFQCRITTMNMAMIRSSSKFA